MPTSKWEWVRRAVIRSFVRDLDSPPVDGGVVYKIEGTPSLQSVTQARSMIHS